MARSIPATLQDIVKLRKDGWTVRKFNPYHYRVTMEGMRTVVDLWPTSRKLWRHGTRGSHVYRDVCMAMAREFSHE